MMATIWQVALDVPLPGPFDYSAPTPLAAQFWSEGGSEFNPIGNPIGDPIGRRVLVPWGRTQRIGLVTAVASESALAPERLRAVDRCLLDLDPLPSRWLELVKFAASYYQVGLGELALPAIPALLRSAQAYRAQKPRGGGPVERARTAWAQTAESVESARSVEPAPVPELTADQAAALESLVLDRGFRVHLLYGVTGSGKTEVYLRAIDRVLSRDPLAQALLLVPEIALTPQFVRTLQSRFPAWPPAVLHSALPEAERSSAWVAALEGRARLVVGTRLAVLAPLARCALIVVDEEHDPSYRQQEGARWSGRDLAVARGRIEQIPVVLGSATPSLETWHNAATGRYHRVDLPRRAVAQSILPAVRLIDMTRIKTAEGLAPQAVAAIEARLLRGEQSLIFLNRRGYAPVLACQSCAWVSSCPNCSVTLALHARMDSATRGWQLICHHCGHSDAVPRSCPACGEVDLAPLGRGTQRLEESIATRFPSARIVRIDRDTTRRRGSTEALLLTVRTGEVDILVGTQMMAKGHDFPRLTLVVVLGADSGLYSHDFRAPERLFATLLQVAGRAGRAEQPGEVLIQTRWPGHPLFAALRAQDYASFARGELHQREAAHLPPFAHQALLCADATAAATALEFLALAKTVLLPCESGRVVNANAIANPSANGLGLGLGLGAIRIAEPVPMPMARLAGRERAQLLLESSSRPTLQALLVRNLPALRALGSAHSKVHWHLEVDPLAI